MQRTSHNRSIFKLGIKLYKKRFFIQIPRNWTVENLKYFLQETYKLKSFGESKPLEISIRYYNTVLKAKWRLTDIISEGSILHIEVEPVTTPLLELISSINLKEYRRIKLLQNPDFKTQTGLKSKISDIKTRDEPCTVGQCR